MKDENFEADKARLARMTRNRIEQNTESLKGMKNWDVNKAGELEVFLECAATSSVKEMYQLKLLSLIIAEVDHCVTPIALTFQMNRLENEFYTNLTELVFDINSMDPIRNAVRMAKAAAAREILDFVRSWIRR